MRGAGVRAGGRWLLRGVDLDLHPGEIVTLVGPNGSGKSTTVRLALGLIEPSEGEVRRDRRATVGFVPQRLNLDASLPLSVRRFMRLSNRLDDRQIGEALDRSGAGSLADASMHDLSGGEFQRVLLARALARSPELLVLDEPAQGVDIAGEEDLYGLISESRRELGCAVLLVSHDLHLVMAATDRVICLNGHVCCQGAPQVVLQDPAYRKLFGPRAGPSLAFYQHHHDHEHLPNGTIRPLGESGEPANGHHGHHDHGHGASGAADENKDEASRPMSEGRQERHHAG